MRPIESLVHSRTRVTQRYALMPFEGFPPSKLPAWPGCEAFILASPKLGAGFVEKMIHVPAGKGTAESPARAHVFGFLVDGEASVTIDGATHGLARESYFLIPEGTTWSFNATADTRLLLLEKPAESAEGANPQPIVAKLADVKAEPWGGSDHGRLQTLIPDTHDYDISMNVFTFDPGYGLPIVETHVMEHGLWFLEGKGLYMLGDDWMEVEQDDFIWMGPYCPQSFYATGPTPARYLYYKNVNREIPL